MLKPIQYTVTLLLWIGLGCVYIYMIALNLLMGYLRGGLPLNIVFHGSLAIKIVGV